MGCAIIAMEQKGEDPLGVTKAKIWHWARWYRWRVENGLPPHSWEGRAILRGGSAPRPQDAAYAMPSNETAEAVEAAMQMMEKRLVSVIKAWHIERLPLRVCAKKCGCSISGFKDMRQRAYWWLDGRLAS